MTIPIMILQKNADKTLNKIVVPKSFVNKWGNSFVMEVYENKIILIPKEEYFKKEK